MVTYGGYSLNSKRLRNPSHSWAALIDRGANGCLAGRDMRMIATYGHTVDLSGLDDHTVRNIPLITAGGVVRTSHGDIIIIIHHAADMIRDSKTILSAGQLEFGGCTILDKSPITNNTTPTIVIPGGYSIPISFIRGLPYIRLRPFTDSDWDNLPHVDITSPEQWEPTCLDSVVPDSWYDSHPPDPDCHIHSLPPPSDSDSDDPSGSSPLPPPSAAIDGHEGDIHPSPFASRPVDRALIHAHLRDLLLTALPVRTRRSTRRPPRARHPPVHPAPITDPVVSCGSPGDDSTDGDSTPSFLPDSDSDSTDGIEPGSNNLARVPLPTPLVLSKPSRRDYSKYARFFPGADLDCIRRTFDATTQLGTRGAIDGLQLRNRLHAPNPILNTPRRNEPVATDTLYSRTHAIDDGSLAAQFFIGRRSHFRSVVPLGTTDRAFASALLDEIRKYGAMDVLISDNAKAQVSERVKDILRTYRIKDWHSEPYQGNQNFAERGWRDTKARTNSLLNSSGAPPELWLQALQYVCVIQNHTAYRSLNNRTPIEWLHGVTPDITVLLQFQFWEPVYYTRYDTKFPADSTEDLGRFVGIAENVGHAMTFKVLTADRKVIHRSVVRSAAKDGAFVNRRADEHASEDVVAKMDPGKPSQVVRERGVDEAVGNFLEKANEDVLRSKLEELATNEQRLPTIDTSGLLGRTFINDPGEDGHQIRAKVDSIEPTNRWTADGSEQFFRFYCKEGEKTFEEILTYNKMLEWCDRDLKKDGYFEISGIRDHRKNPDAGYGYEVLVEWGDGTATWNDLKVTFQDDPVTVSMYAKDNGLLSTPGWKNCKRIVKSGKQLARMVNQARLKSHRTRPVYKYGFQVPRNHEEAVKIDEKYGNTKWQDAERLEIQQLLEYDTFKDIGEGTPIPEGYTKIPCHMVYDVKHDGRHKARMVAGGHRTSTPVDSVYSGVVSLTGVRLVTFLAELNDLELWGTDIGNAYLESYTKEKVAFIAGGEFGALAGHTLIIVKALYGLKSSGARWHDRLFDVLRDMGFRPSKAHPDIWMRRCKGRRCYEYIAVYVDDLLIASNRPHVIILALESPPYRFKLKGTGPVTFHLGCDFFRDGTGTLCMGPKTYIERIASQYVSMFGTKPKMTYTSPLASNDHPEFDTTELLGEEGIQQYQSLLGTLQWAISIGRLDIATAVMTMSGFRAAPRIGHLDRLRRVCGYLCKMKQGFIRVRTEEPDYTGLDRQRYDWERTVYGNVVEEPPRDAPEALGKPVVMTTYVDANLCHDMATGRSVTAVLHFINQTPIEWFSKKQATVETATYGSEFVAAKTAVQQIMGMRTALRYLGVEIKGPTHLFGDNGSVVTSGSLPHSPLKKRHHVLAYHYTREAIAAGAVDFQFLPGHLNPADILSKHWGYQQVWASALRPILFWQGDTSVLLEDEVQPVARNGKVSDAEPPAE